MSQSFAEKMMLKQGWNKGQGLGRENQGIAEPIKASLKFDTTGIGHDIAKEFTNNWWDYAYKKASNKIEIEETQDGEINIKSKKRNRKAELKEAKKQLYSGFVKSATLTNGKLEEDSESKKAEEEEVKFEKLSDEDLFKAVGGFTGHKLARHGVKESAKLKRIEAMDKKILDLSESSVEPAPKKKKKKSKDQNEDAEKHLINTSSVMQISEETDKKKKKKKDKRPDDGTHENFNIDTSSALQTTEELVQKKKKKKKSKEVENSEEKLIDLQISEEPVQKKKKKKKSKENESPKEKLVDEEIVLKKKRKKSKQDEDVEDNFVKEKKKSKRH